MTLATYLISQEDLTQVRPPAELAFSSETAGKDGPTIGADGSIFFGANSGVWTLPPDAPDPVSTP